MAVVVADVQFSYRRGFSLGPLSFHLEPGIVCLVGANGAGKSTLFTLLAGLQRPRHGRVELTPPSSVGYLPQSPDLPGHATAEEFLHYVAWIQGVRASARASAVSDVLGAVDLTAHAGSRIRTLSGGMQRRLGVAAALVHNPALVLLDEPTVGLDPLQRISVREALKESHGDRVLIVATHLVEDVRTLADRVLVLSEGALVFDGDVERLESLSNPDAPGESALERAIAMLMSSR